MTTKNRKCHKIDEKLSELQTFGCLIIVALVVILAFTTIYFDKDIPGEIRTIFSDLPREAERMIEN